MDSNLKVAKLDAFDVLTQGAEIFGVKRLEPHLREIWQILHKEIMQNIDCEIKNASLKCTTSLINALTVDKSIFNDFVEEIIINAKWSLCNAPASSVKNTEKLLEAIANANKEMCEKVLCAVVPVCLTQYSTKTALRDKILLLRTFNNFIAVANKYQLSIKSMYMNHCSSIIIFIVFNFILFYLYCFLIFNFLIFIIFFYCYYILFYYDNFIQLLLIIQMLSDISNLEWSDVPAFYLEELNNVVPEIQIKAMEGLIAQRSSLNETQRAILYERLFHQIEIGNENTLFAAHACLYSFTESHPNEVVNIITSRFSINDSKLIMKSRLIIL